MDRLADIALQDESADEMEATPQYGEIENQAAINIQKSVFNLPL